MTEIRAKMLEEVVISWAISFLFIYMCMAMLSQARIAAV
jgi:hypothetical protein